MGCTNCKGKSGCTDRKGSMLGTVEDWLQRLYPTRTWGELDDELALESGVDELTIQGLAQELGDELKGAAIFKPGGDEDLCDYIYILCQGREPCALQVQYGGVPMPEELTGDMEVNEFYLRVALSSVAPLVVVQQVAVSMSMVDGAWVLREEISPGVYDGPLLRRFQRLVAILPAYDVVHVDMGEVSAPPVEFLPGGYPVHWGAPHTVNYLFFQQPSSMTTTTCVGESL